MSDGLSRRSFIKLAATAGAAAAIPGCEPAARHLIPYVVPDENVIPGVPQFYATTCNECPAGCGVIARVREGRVVKLEGNPSDPISQGALCARGQAALQGLYNPDKLRAPMMKQDGGALRKASWDDALKTLNQRLKEAAGKGPNRVAFIGSPQGPTLQKIVTAFAGAYGSNRVVYYEPLRSGPARDAAQFVFGRRDLPTYQIDQAEILVSFGADFLETWHSPVELARQYAAFRAPKTRRGALSIGRAIYFGPRFNMTAARTDEWIAAPPGAEAMLALAVLGVMLKQGWVQQGAGIDLGALKNFAGSYDPDSVSQRTGVPAAAINRVAQLFGKADGAVALAGGDDPTAYAAAYILNAATGNLGRTMTFFEGAPEDDAARMEDISGTLDAMRGGQVEVVLVAGSNPLYAMAPAWKAADAFAKTPFVVWAGGVPDETAAAAHLLLPTHHPLETWRDAFPRAGVHGLGQPVMQPVFDSKPLGDILIAAAQQGGGAQKPPWKDTAEAVKTEWAKLNPKAVGPAAEDFWIKSLREGGWFEAPSPAKPALNTSGLKTPPTAPELPKLALAAYPHLFLHDGRGADKPWLQEIPEPVTQIVWDSWAEIHPDTAKQIGVNFQDVVELRSSEGTISAPVYVSERVARGVIAVPLGQGHTALGRYAKDRGTNAFAALKPGQLSIGVSAHSTGARARIVSPTGGDYMFGRSIAEAVSVRELAGNIPPEYEEEKPPTVPYEAYASFAPMRKRMWGMTIDSNACTGCSACIAACYAENNVPIVGKQKVEWGHHMQWIRIDRFFPDPHKEEPQPMMYLVPMLCQQCDHAPCEPVCPVFAAVHTEEGLNGQIYNRCVGTRYCENNCPYKVRKFNWFDPEWPEPLNLQLNPDVTQRSAGVMEKCTFCIQRIMSAEITAKIEKRELKDGEIITACAQACPTHAISFGDMKDQQSAMMKRRGDNHNRGYRSLDELNTLPAIVYLRSVYHEREKA